MPIVSLTATSNAPISISAADDLARPRAGATAPSNGQPNAVET